MPKHSNVRLVEFEHPDDPDRRIRVGACHKDPHDPSHSHYDATTWQPDELPAFVDLRQHLSPVEDQGDLGSCTANALAGAIEYLENRLSGEAVDVSRLFIYWNEREVDGATDQDHGACLADGVKTLREKGVCAEELWPYDPKMVFEAPEDHCFSAAEPHTIDEAHKVKIDLHDMRHCLAEGYPFVFGLEVYDSFQEIKKDGIVRVPKKGTHEHCGGHAMLCVGYSDKDRVFVVRNSWGSSWGDGGYCYIPYDYLTDPQYAHDAWTLRKAHDLDFSQGVGGADQPNGSQDSFFDQDETQDSDDDASDTQDDADDDADDAADSEVDSDDTTDTDDADTTDSDDSADASDAETDAEIAKLDAEIAELDAEIAELDRELGNEPKKKKR